MTVKKFLRKVILFALPPLLVIAITEAFFLPPNFFTYRTWEALIYKNPVPHLGGFYPDMHTIMDEQGDLAFRTKYAIVDKDVKWDIDKLGFRNNKFVEDPDALIIGDSFTAGIALSQDETITNKTQMLLGKKLKVYNIAPSSFGNFNFLYQNKFIQKPRLIIYSLVERNLPSILTIEEEAHDRKLKLVRSAGKSLDFKGFNTCIDRLISFNSLRWAAAKMGETNIGHKSPFDSTLFFMQGKEVKHFALKDAEATAKKIISYKKYCDDAGIRFIFMPMPNKETVYFDLVPFDKQPQFLFQLDSILHQSGVETINTLSIYNGLRSSVPVLYKPDDTHWNAKATTIIAEEIVKHPVLQKMLQAK